MRSILLNHQQYSALLRNPRRSDMHAPRYGMSASVKGRPEQVAQAAYRVGYKFPNNFSAAFTRLFGKPPKSVLGKRR